ncbi:MAG TPA: hypothetical protein PKL49_05895 [Steroidobacteraceae bacterium]|nr:hypothetical protein [Steroidobacteraceae bacterium]HNS27120.1 hypothetical protein [Steroidobacteraceae bacterium]
MLVKTPAMRIDVHVESVKVDGKHLLLAGLAGHLPCEMRAGAPELRALLRLALKPRILLWLLRGKT